MDFAERFREAFRGLTIADIARKLSIPHATARNYFNGRLPATDILIKIANETSVSLNWLLTGKGAQRLNNSSKEDDAVKPLQANEVESKSEAQDEEEIRDLLNEYFLASQLVAILHELRPDERTDVLLFAKSIADPSSVRTAYARDSGTDRKKKAS